MKARNNTSNILFCLLAVLFLGSCSQKTFDTPKELMTYVLDSENGYAQHKVINGIDFSITYRPTDMLVQQEMDDNTSKEMVDSLRKKYSKYMYFNIGLAKNDQEVLTGLASNKKKFGTMVNRLAFGMGEKVHLFSATKDTVPLADYIYPRLYGMGRGTQMLFVYPRDRKLFKDDFFHLTIEDMGLTTGEVGFKIPVQLIINEPLLEFN